jgi:hypothetical protein
LTTFFEENLRLGLIKFEPEMDLVLQAFADKLNTIINSAGTQGRLIAIEAGQQIWLTIYNAKLAYADERNKTFAQLNATIQGDIQTPYTALDTLEREGFAKSEEIIRQAQQVPGPLHSRGD